MKNEKLKNLITQKMKQGETKFSSGITLLNREELLYAVGGGGPCPVLTSCGTYSVCGINIDYQN